MGVEQPRLGIDKGSRHVSINGTRHPIEMGTPFSPEEGYTIHPYGFTGEKGRHADGVLFKIRPFQSTRVMRITDPTVKMQEIAIDGSGYFLGMSPTDTAGNKEIIIHKVAIVEGQVNNNPLIEQQAGWVGVWIAGPKGLEVLDVTEPPFQEVMETHVPWWDTSLPLEFWTNYDRMKDPTKKQT